jgi:8-oxo-dGTP pyrophosphatase MutT (NUDIX family)
VGSPLRAWTLIDKQLALSARVFRIWLSRWRSPRTQLEHTFTVIDSADFVNVIAVDTADNLVMIRQFRLGAERFTLEVPGGMIDPGEQPAAAAERELYEESGYRAERWVELGAVETNPAIFNNRAHMFLAEGCVHAGAQVLDDGEDIEVVTIPVTEVVRMLHDGRIDHALVAVILHRFQLYRAGLLDLGASSRAP